MLAEIRSTQLFQQREGLEVPNVDKEENKCPWQRQQPQPLIPNLHD